MIVVGLTGRIGAGKSTVAAMLADRGAVVVDADRLAHAVLREPDVIRAIATRHGGKVLDAGGQVDRRKLAAEVFGPTADHAGALAALEALVHPRVVGRIDAILGDERASERAGGPPAVVVLDVPLLGRPDLLARCDRVLEVVCDDAVRGRRLAARGWGEDERKARDAAWERHAPPPAVGAAAAGNRASVDTSRDLIYTSTQVDQFFRSLQPMRRETGE